MAERRPLLLNGDLPADAESYPHGEQKPSSSDIPGRQQMLLLSVLFVLASALLLAGFVLLHYKVFDPPQLANFVFSLSCIFWLQGFVLLVHWMIYAVPLNGVALSGAMCKLIASCLFNIQPGSALIEQEAVGVKWSNFAGICCFHVGNMISVYDMRTMYSRKNPFAEGNLPVYGMWCYLIATSFLVAANAIVYWEVESSFTYPAQAFGSTMLLIGSIVYCYWAR